MPIKLDGEPWGDDREMVKHIIHSSNMQHAPVQEGGATPLLQVHDELVFEVPKTSYWVDYRMLTDRALLKIMVWGVKARVANKLRKYWRNCPHPSPPLKFPVWESEELRLLKEIITKLEAM